MFSRVLLLACDSAWSVNQLNPFILSIYSTNLGGLDLVPHVDCTEIITHGPCLQGTQSMVEDADTESSSSLESQSYGREHWDRQRQLHTQSG